jgi:hypothetical protein
MEEATLVQHQQERQRGEPIFSRRFGTNGIVELVHDADDQRTQLAVWQGNGVRYSPHLEIANRLLTPYSPQNTLLQHGVILLPSGAQDYGTDRELLERIQAYIHRYVDLEPTFERLASYYVLLTWVYDDFNELPYLRVRGDYGSGKTRFLVIVGGICYKPIFASGAATTSPVFRILDASRGTLVIDESDFRASDERVEIIKILNQGNAKGFPVLRTETNRYHELNPRAYQVFGPKVIATRGLFQDRALESRCITETLGGRRLRFDIPINLPDSYRQEAQELRNQLLMFRFWHAGRVHREPWIDRRLEPRLNQVLAPLMQVMNDDDARAELISLALTLQRQLVSDRGLDAEAQVLDVIHQLETHSQESSLSVKAIAETFAERHSQDYARPITPRWVGSLIRQRLGLATERRHGSYWIAAHERSKLRVLYESYGLTIEGQPVEPP